MLKLEMLPAEYGDCLWIEYGDSRAPRRILVDAGLSSVYKDISSPSSWHCRTRTARASS